MRKLSTDLERRIANKIQTLYNENEPKAIAKLNSMSPSLLRVGQSLETKNITDHYNQTFYRNDLIAIEHTTAGEKEDAIWIMYPDDNQVKLFRGAYTEKLSDTVFVEKSLDIPFTKSLAMAFDGTMIAKQNGVREFITEDKPWIFWLERGSIRGKKYGSENSVTVFDSGYGIDYTSAVRARYSTSVDSDFGLVVFGLVAGSSNVYYRQYIHSVWYDVEELFDIPDGIKFYDISANRMYNGSVSLLLWSPVSGTYKIDSE